MRKLILKMSVSVDGFVSGPHGELDWMFKSLSDEAKQWTVDILSQAGVHIMGSKTFYDMKSYWPYSTDVLAAPMNEIPKIVFSKKGTIEKNAGNITTQAIRDAPKVNTSNNSFMFDWDRSIVLKGDLEKEILILKQQEGKPVFAHGGASFAQNLVATGLVDEFILVTHPVAIGKGLPLFSKLKKTLDLQLMDLISFRSGVVARVYKPV